MLVLFLLRVCPGKGYATPNYCLSDVSCIFPSFWFCLSGHFHFKIKFRFYSLAAFLDNISFNDIAVRFAANQNAD